ncbi:hypothetical protein BTA51_13060 [Hahella sp. CCB-MM4]|uniref:hypothetical protein n=1 Tax=Hahella sp. (strain CCB-MM4) TaxID=1926491 RepID=UPI000B9C2BDF|nr:hypothetical protein [Hahella sp. CCB-MM4]OZG72894.1 hypothetical protein BTA51_13060 [Hahella sp. CCB-MM4]
MSELSVLREKIESLVREEQWHQIAAMDEIVRDVVGKALESVTDESREAVRAQLNDIQQFYATAVARMQSRQGESAQELSSMQKSYRAAKSYLDSSKL